MTIEQLMKELKDCDPKTEVEVIDDRNGDDYKLKDVIVIPKGNLSIDKEIVQILFDK